LAISNPVAFGRATRIKQHVTRLADRLGTKDRWQTEVAAMLSQLSTITLPNETAEKLYYGTPLTPEEQRMVERAPDISEQLMAHIPRLETVREILAARVHPYRSQEGVELTAEQRMVRRGAQLLKAAIDFDTLEARGLSGAQALDNLKLRAEQYDPEVLRALTEECGSQAAGETIREVSLAALKPGMIFASDVKMANGTLFVARGYEITESFLERIRNFRPGSVKEPFRVVIRAS
jgi:response regulator RpfG family c-di-GMP phosphodiesterase